jgi:hypothetical protein
MTNINIIMVNLERGVRELPRRFLRHLRILGHGYASTWLMSVGLRKLSILDLDESEIRLLASHSVRCMGCQ